MNKRLKALFEILLIVFLFLVLAYFVQIKISFFEKFLGKNIVGFSVYTFIVIIAIVIAPVSSIPLTVRDYQNIQGKCHFRQVLTVPY